MPLGQSTLIVSIRSLSENIADRQDEDSEEVLSPDYIRFKWSERLLINADRKAEYDQIVRGRTFDQALPILEAAVVAAYHPDIWSVEAYSQALLATDRYYRFLVCNITAAGNSEAALNNRPQTNPQGDVLRHRRNRCEWRTAIDLDGIDRRGNPQSYTVADLLDPDTFVDLCVRVEGVGGSINQKSVVKQKGPI